MLNVTPEPNCSTGKSINHGQYVHTMRRPWRMRVLRAAARSVKKCVVGKVTVKAGRWGPEPVMS